MVGGRGPAPIPSDRSLVWSAAWRAGRDAGTALVRFAMSKPESTEGASAAADFRKGFAHENRLSILCCLAAREMSVSELERALGIR